MNVTSSRPLHGITLRHLNKRIPKEATQITLLLQTSLPNFCVIGHRLRTRGQLDMNKLPNTEMSNSSGTVWPLANTYDSTFMFSDALQFHTFPFRRDTPVRHFHKGGQHARCCVLSNNHCVSSVMKLKLE